MRGIKTLRNKAKAIKMVKNLLGKNFGGLLKTMDHTNSCEDCNNKLMGIFACAGISVNDTKFGVLKLAKHLPKCKDCQISFKAIADHANCQIEIKELSNELSKVNM